MPATKKNPKTRDGYIGMKANLAWERVIRYGDIAINMVYLIISRTSIQYE